MTINNQISFQNIFFTCDGELVIVQESNKTEECCFSKEQTHVLYQILQIFYIQSPQGFIFEGTQPPNDECKHMAIKTYIHLFKKYKLIPERIAVSCEGGLYFQYEHFEKVLEIEVFNSGEIAGIVSRAEYILYSEDIIDFCFNNLMALFFE